MLNSGHEKSERTASPIVFSAPENPQTRRERVWLDGMLQKQTPFYTEVLVTPSLAEMMLERNTANRPVTPRHVKEYARLIKQGLFFNSPQPLSFDRNGTLLDGQHRLLAVCEAATAARMRCFFGEDPAIFTILDTGRKRTTSDIFGITKIENAAEASTCVRYDRLISDGYRHINGTVYSNAELLDLFLTDPAYEKIQDAIRLKRRVSHHIGRQGRVNSGFTVAVLRILRVNNNFGAVEEFIEAIARGINISSVNSPILRLRKRLFDVVKSPIETAALTIKAWNMHLTSRPCASLAFYDRESFPEPLIAN